MTAIIMLRHPQTTWNLAERYQGRLDSPLSEEGWHQLALTADAFRGQSLDAVISSPLSRTLSLADAVARVTGAPLYTDARLTEIGQGSWEGLHVSEIKTRFPDIFGQWRTRPDLVRFPGGESLCEVEPRTSSAVRDVFRQYPGGTVAVVTHSVVVQVVAARSLGLELRHLHSIKASNGGITTICGNDAPGWLLSLNVTLALHGSPVESARAERCAGISQWRQTT